MESKNFNLSNTGLSERQIAEHIKLYEGYCRKIDEIREKILIDKKQGNATYSEIRELKIEEGFCINAIKLHEMYFENLNTGNEKISHEVIKMIEEDFGSFEAWKKEFISLALSARGWVVLAYDWKDDKLHNYIADMHNQGGIWGAIPMLVLDVYEHAYFIDFGTDRKKYIETFLEKINWKIVEDRCEKF